ncbi:MAG: hypothetical protein QOD99_785 [Chthoniobacter sp.]|jgi:hypothetical protein|nr:hypothetical protein [Chthoniobacter sp.]
MKQIVTGTIAVFLSATLALAAPAPVVLATASGTIFREEDASETDSRIKTSPFNNARIFSEFQVSKNDYVLVTDVLGNNLTLKPISASSSLSSIRVLDFSYTGNHAIVDTRTGHLLNQATISSPATATLFKGISGRVSSLEKIDENTSRAKSLTYTILATGTNPAATDQSVFIQAKIHGAKVFTQTP